MYAYAFRCFSGLGYSELIRRVSSDTFEGGVENARQLLFASVEAEETASHNTSNELDRWNSTLDDELSWPMGDSAGLFGEALVFW